MFAKGTFLLILLIEIFLSHQGGAESGAESRALARSLHIPEKVLRTAAHTISFLTLSLTGGLSFGWYGLIAVCAWCMLDEITKPWLRNGRHFSWKDVGFNVLGAGIGTLLWLLL